MRLPHGLVLATLWRRTQSTKAKAMEALQKKKTLQTKGKGKFQRKERKAWKGGKRWKGFEKRGLPRQDRGEEHRRRWKEKHKKRWNDRKKQRRQKWRQSKERSTMTFTKEERLFMNLMKGANEEDWNFFGQFGT